QSLDGRHRKWADYYNMQGRYQLASGGMRTDKQFRGDLLRGQSSGRLVEDLFFPAGDLGYALQPVRGFPLHDFGRLRTQEAPAVDDGTDAVDDFLPRRIFLDIAVGAF